MLDPNSIKRSVKMSLYICVAQVPWIAGVSALRRLPLRKNSLRILMYHKVCDQKLSVINVGITLFRRHQEYLARNYQTISLDELDAYIDGKECLPDKAVLLTFDDGYKNNFTEACAILKEFGHRAVIFVPTDFIGGGILPHDRDVRSRQPVADWSDMAAMSDVFEIGSHGCSHRRLTTLTRPEFEREIRASKEILEAGLGRPVRAFAYPYGSSGDFSAETEAAVKDAGYKFCFTTIPGTNLPGMRALRLKRYGVEDFGMGYFKRLLDGSADLVGLKDTRLGYRLKHVINGAFAPGT